MGGVWLGWEGCRLHSLCDLEVPIVDMGAKMSIAVVRERESFGVEYSLGGFFAGYTGNTHNAYQQDLRTFVGWCQTQHLAVFEVCRRSQQMDRPQVPVVWGTDAAMGLLCR